MTPERAPSGLQVRGRHLWHEIIKGFELSDAERTILREACRTADLVDRLAAELEGGELIVTGSRGQSVLNPVAAELRQQRDLLTRLLMRLALPEEGEDAAGSVLGRRGAMTRWYGRRTG